MAAIDFVFKLKKNSGDRRFKLERRIFSYSFHIPERRSGKERRENSILEYLRIEEAA